MSLIQNIENWGDTHHPKWIDILRIGFGVLLFMRGIVFIQDIAAVESMVLNTTLGPYAAFVAHYVATAHLFGGVLITIGLITRTAVAFQFPVLLGAIIFVNAPMGFVNPNSELSFSLLVLFLLVFFFIYGSGTIFSADHWLKTHKEK